MEIQERKERPARKVNLETVDWTERKESPGFGARRDRRDGEVREVFQVTQVFPGFRASMVLQERKETKEHR